MWAHLRHQNAQKLVLLCTAVQRLQKYSRRWLPGWAVSLACTLERCRFYCDKSRDLCVAVHHLSRSPYGFLQSTRPGQGSWASALSNPKSARLHRQWLHLYTWWHRRCMLFFWWRQLSTVVGQMPWEALQEDSLSADSQVHSHGYHTIYNNRIRELEKILAFLTYLNEGEVPC